MIGSNIYIGNPYGRNYEGIEQVDLLQKGLLHRRKFDAYMEILKLNSITEKRGRTMLVSMQNLYNLVYREEEREINTYWVDGGIICIP